MRRILPKTLLACVTTIICTMITPSPTQAQELTANEATTEDWKQWPLIGRADLDVLFFDIYTSELRAPQGRYTLGRDLSPHPVALSITYERDISKKHLIKETGKQWRNLGYAKEQSLAWLDRLEGIYPDVALGEQLVYVTDGQLGSFFYIRNDGSSELRGEVIDEALNDAFLAIWLSPQTEYPKHRLQLLGMN